MDEPPALRESIPGLRRSGNLVSSESVDRLGYLLVHPYWGRCERGGRLIGAVRRRVEGGNDRGAAATEYGLLVAFIALAIVLGLTAFGGALNTLFANLRRGSVCFNGLCLADTQVLAPLG